MSQIQAQTYEIRIEGHIEAHRLGQGEDWEIVHLPDGDTRIRVPTLDQAALYGLLNRFRDLGLTLVSLMRL